jgi:hypothetical protein
MRPDLKRSGKVRQSLAHSAEPQASMNACHPDGIRVETDSIVAHGATEHVILPDEANDDAGRTRVPGHVRQRFLHGPVDEGLDGGRQAAAGRSLNRDTKSGSPGNALCKEFHTGHEAEIIQEHRPELVREAAELLLDLGEHVPDDLHAFACAVRQLGPKILQGHVDAGKQLARLVVQRMSNPSGLSLQDLMQGPGSRRRVAGRPLERRECLHQEFFGGSHASGIVLVSWLEQEVQQSIMVQRCKFTDADAGIASSLPEPVCLAKLAGSRRGEVAL